MAPYYLIILVVIVAAVIGYAVFSAKRENTAALTYGLGGKVPKPSQYDLLVESLERLFVLRGTEIRLICHSEEVKDAIMDTLRELNYPDIKIRKNHYFNNISIAVKYEGYVYHFTFSMDALVSYPEERRKNLKAETFAALSAYQKKTKTQRMIDAAKQERRNEMA